MFQHPRFGRAGSSSRTAVSLISAGTERTKVETGEKNLLQKARARPDLVKKVVDRARVEGVGAAIGVARDRLSALAPLGYSSAGVVLEVGAGVEGIAPGDRVACGGGGWANHAEIVAVPQEPRRARADGRRVSTTPPTPRSARSRCTASARPRSGSASGSA